MGCVVSSEGDDDRRRIIGVSAAGSHHHHIVSLTSSTYGILTAPRAYDVETQSSSTPPPPPPPLPVKQPSPPEEVINSWELMAGLLDPSSSTPRPPADNVAVLYTTSLRAVRATFEACNAVRAALQAHGVAFRERDVSMDRGFRDDLLRLLPGPETPLRLPRFFVRGRHVGGADEVLRLDEEGKLAPLLEGLPKATARGGACDGCGGISFLPCFDCSGSRKLAVPLLPNDSKSKYRRRPSSLVVRCRECNENGLVLCPICS